MRDDFSNRTKELLAKRVGFKCSHPDCRKPTSGPHTDPSKAINVGVAAHITAASPNGPRYNSTLTPEQRRAPENGIWMCQTHGKLVDSDEAKYRVEDLKEWKRRAEKAAELEVEHNLQQSSDFAAIFERMERLMPTLLAEMRNDLSSYPLRREFVVKGRGQGYSPKGNELFYYYDDHADLDDKLHILETVGLIQNITYNNAKRFAISEQLAIYLDAP